MSRHTPFTFGQKGLAFIFRSEQMQQGRRASYPVKNSHGKWQVNVTGNSAEEQQAIEDTPRFQNWQAFSGTPEDARPIITVIARTQEDAKAQIRVDLQRNPSRVPYFRRWQEDGEQVRAKVFAS